MPEPRPGTRSGPFIDLAPTLATLLLALGAGPILAFVSNRFFGDAPSVPIVVILQLVFYAIAGAVLVVVTKVERLPLASIGLRRPDWNTVLTIVMIVAAAQGLSLVTGAALAAFGDPAYVAQRAAPLYALPWWVRFFIASTAGFVEETLYRGYAIERLTAVTGRRWLAATIATVVFGLSHIPGWGVAFSLIADLPFGMLMTLFYLWRRDLFANGFAHSAGLFIALCV